MREVFFSIEGVGIKLPPGFEYQNTHMPLRVLSEPLTRLVLGTVLSSSTKSLGVLAFGKSLELVDLGAWIGDSSLPIAKSHPGIRVVAIDPSDENIEFVASCAAMNGMENIKCIKALISDSRGETYVSDGVDIRHSSFSSVSAKDGEKLIASTTLDLLFERKIINPSVIHLDAEGMELLILKGGVNILHETNPVIIFESHLFVDPLGETLKLLSSHDYCVFMINERLSGNDPDCRNFLAVPAASEALYSYSHALIEEIVNTSLCLPYRKICQISNNLMQVI